MPSQSRAAARAIALVLLAAQTTAVLHLVLARHRVCPDHGDVVEHGPADSGDAAAARPARTPVVRGVPHHPRAHGHDHCLTAPKEDEGVAPKHELAALPLGDAVRPMFRPATVAAPRGPPVYRLAPKNSPPA